MADTPQTSELTPEQQLASAGMARWVSEQLDTKLAPTTQAAVEARVHANDVYSHPKCIYKYCPYGKETCENAGGCEHQIHDMQAPSVPHLPYPLENFILEPARVVNVWCSGLSTSGANLLLGRAERLSPPGLEPERWMVNSPYLDRDQGFYESIQEASTRLLEIYNVSHGSPPAAVPSI